MIDFYKFPSTPHLAALGDLDIRDDKLLSDVEREQLLQHEVLVEEKIDGANLGISFNHDGELLLQNRGTLISLPAIGQWKHLETWINARFDRLFDSLTDRFILFGEWCYAKHSVYYDSLPDWFIGFDVFDKKGQRFFSVEKRNKLFAELNIAVVPFIGFGQFNLEELERLFSLSLLSSVDSEGLYIRYDVDGWLNTRAKLVRPEFIQSVGEHWSKTGIEPNEIKY